MSDSRGRSPKHAEHPSPAALTLIRRDAEGSAGLPKGTSAVGFEKKGKQAVAAVRDPESARPPPLSSCVALPFCSQAVVGGERAAQPTAGGRSGVFGSMRRPGRAAGAPCGRGVALGSQRW